MHKTLAKIACMIEGEVIGDECLIIKGLSNIQQAQEGDITFVAHSKYVSFVKDCKASAIITSRDINIPGRSTIRVNNPSLAFAKVGSMFAEENFYRFKGIHPSAVIADSVRLGHNVSVGPHVVIEDQCEVGDDTVIYAGCYIGHKSQIGQNCVIHPNVTIQYKTCIKNHVVIHSGSVLGSDGFGYVQVDGKHHKIPQLGIVVVEDNVEIGSNATIDRARFDKTVIGRGTKIDNLVHVAHNVILEEDCIIISQVGISGSTVIKKGSILAGQSGVAGHVTIGAGVIVSAKAGVTKSIPDGQTVFGFPAKPVSHARRVNAVIQKLPKIVKDLNAKIESIEKKLNNGS